MRREGVEVGRTDNCDYTVTGPIEAQSNRPRTVCVRACVRACVCEVGLIHCDARCGIVGANIVRRGRKCVCVCVCV